MLCSETEGTVSIPDSRRASDTSSGTERETLEEPRKGQRRPRTSMTPVQIRILSRVLEHTAFPSKSVRARLSKVLGIHPRTVQVWFQNQRQKAKSTMAEARSIGRAESTPATSPIVPKHVEDRQPPLQYLGVYYVPVPTGTMTPSSPLSPLVQAATMNHITPQRFYALPAMPSPLSSPIQQQPSMAPSPFGSGHSTPRYVRPALPGIGVPYQMMCDRMASIQPFAQPAIQPYPPGRKIYPNIVPYHKSAPTSPT